MIRTILKDNRVLFGPLQDRQLNVVSRAPEFSGHGIHAQAHSGHVDVYVTLPMESERVRKVQAWFLRNHNILA
jgi:hypothetical protein